jgi:hypothetical protein
MLDLSSDSPGIIESTYTSTLFTLIPVSFVILYRTSSLIVLLITGIFIPVLNDNMELYGYGLFTLVKIHLNALTIASFLIDEPARRSPSVLPCL